MNITYLITLVQEESPGGKTNKEDPPLFCLVRISGMGLKLRISMKTFSNSGYKII